MRRYIDKDVLVAEFKRRISLFKKEKKIEKWSAEASLYANVISLGARIAILEEILSFLNTLEVKEVDLEEEVDKWYNNEAPKEFEHILYRDIENFAKYFFELGLKAKDK